MKLIPEAKRWHQFWSIRFAILSALSAGFGALEVALPLWQGIVSPQAFALISTVLAVASAISRVIQQEIKGRDDCRKG